MKKGGSSKVFGIKKRKQDRKRRKERIHDNVDRILNGHLENLISASSSVAEYEKYVQRINNELESLYQKFEEFREARNYLSRQINQGNAQKRWSLAVPEYLIRIKRPRPLRTHTWFKQVAGLHRWRIAWLTHMESQTVFSAPVSEDERLACCLISAALHGGLCISDALLALAEHLRTQERPLLVLGEWAWIDLVMDCKSEALNYEKNGEPVTLRRWYPDSITLGMIGRYLKERTLNKRGADDLTQPDFWSVIKRYAKTICDETDIKLFEKRAFCNAAVGVAESLPGVRLPQALVEYSIGRISSASISPKNQRALFGSITFPEISCRLSDFQKPSDQPAFNKRASQSLDCNYERLISEIRLALSVKVLSGTKNTPKNAAKELQKVLESKNLPTPALILVDWLYTLLHEQKNAVSTARRYFSAVGKPWLSATVSIDVENLDEAGFEGLYHDMLDAEISEKSRRFNTARLQQLHTHGVTRFGLTPLTGELNAGLSKLQATVRSAYITEAQFAGLWKNVESIRDLDELTKQGLVCLLMISFRVGLRRGELLKLRICDVENSEKRWLFVRNNSFGDNKSSSALRKIPLAIFLTRHERDYFENYLNRRKVYIGSDKKALLFSLLAMSHVPHDGNMLSSMVRYILKCMTGSDYTFHHLRHTAISRIYAVLEADDELISVVSPYSLDEAKKLRQAIHNIDDEGAVRDIYWSLSAVAGHASPETTFSNYIHFCDKALGARLQQTTASFSKVAIAQMTGLTANKLTRLCTKYSVSGDVYDPL